MKSFRDLEAEYSRAHVRIEPDGAGILTLAGDKTEAVISGPSLVRLGMGEPGWRDFWLVGPNGAPILLHNALITSSGSRNWGNTQIFEKTIFPNIVVVGADALDDKHRLTRVSFVLNGLNQFFPYRFHEWHSLRDMPKGDRESLRRLRGDDEPSRDYDFFKPAEAYLVHRTPRFFKFRLGDKSYDVQAFRNWSPGFGGFSFETWPVASICYSQPVSVVEALHDVSEWRGYFEGMAISPMKLLAVDCMKRGIRARRPAQLYLPNLDPTAEDDANRSHLGSLPMTQWSQRGAMAKAMVKWLSQGESRQYFRSALRQVVAQMSRRISMDLVLKLCAGIESLGGFTVEGAPDKAALRAMADAATGAAVTRGIAIQSERVFGALSSLGRVNLPARLNAMGQVVSQGFPAVDFKPLFKAAETLRHQTAHGKVSDETGSETLGHTIWALAAFCIYYDFLSCGIDEILEAGHLRQELGDAMKVLGRLQK